MLAPLRARAPARNDKQRFAAERELGRRGAIRFHRADNARARANDRIIARGNRLGRLSGFAEARRAQGWSRTARVRATSANKTRIILLSPFAESSSLASERRRLTFDPAASFTVKGPPPPPPHPPLFSPTVYRVVVQRDPYSMSDR